MRDTLQNLAKAFIGESQARNRYSFYAKIAKDDGFEQIAEIFLLTADNEREHAKRLFEYIQQLKEKLGGNLAEITVNAACPTAYGTVAENLQSAIEGEHYEASQLYPKFAQTAKEEGLPEVAERLLAIAKAEEHHGERFKKLLEQVEAGTVFKKEEEVWWVCRECGYPHFGFQPPETCPSCDHNRSFYQLKCEQY